VDAACTAVLPIFLFWILFALPKAMSSRLYVAGLLKTKKSEKQWIN
jgi:hypothetical protein